MDISIMSRCIGSSISKHENGTIFNVHTATMTSREIAKLTNKNHKHVLRDIDVMIGKLDSSNDTTLPLPKNGLGYKKTTYLSNNQARPMYELDYRNTLNLLMGYSAEFRMVIIDRWMDVTDAAKRHNAIEKKREDDRQLAKLEWPLMEDAITITRERARKDRAAKGIIKPGGETETERRHFMGEYKMINVICIGMNSATFKKLNGIDSYESIRDYITPFQIKAIQGLQAFNTELIYAGLEFKNRKALLASRHDLMIELELDLVIEHSM